MSPEEQARTDIDRLLTVAGWNVVGVQDADLRASRGVAIREFPLDRGFGLADYLLYVDGKAAGVIEAKKRGATLTGVEIQSARYAQGLHASLPAWRRPLPFVYESTGAETHFTNGLDPEPRVRNVFAIHVPATLASWLDATPSLRERVERRGEGRSESVGNEAGEGPAPYQVGTFLTRVRAMPELVTEWGEHKLWPAQITAIGDLELDPPRFPRQVSAWFSRPRTEPEARGPCS